MDLKKPFIRIFQFSLYTLTYLMPFKEPKLIEGLDLLPKKIKELNLKKPLLVIDPYFKTTPFFEKIEEGIKKEGLDISVYSEIKPNPSISQIENGLKVYLENNCDSLIAFGGGSTMDTAKAIGARVARPKKSIQKLGGLLKVGKKIPILFAIPTTAGSGSETTIAAVVTDENNGHKYAINDLHLIPEYAVLDPELTVSLSKDTTAFTGMDALTHAVEGYLSKGCPKKHKRLAEEAVRSIIKYLPIAYEHGDNIEARREMLHASYKAGVVFTRAGLTYVHPIAHTLGGLYGVTHGLANAVILPECLKYYGKSVYKKLWNLARISGLQLEEGTYEEGARIFIDRIRKMNDLFSITRKFDIENEDIKRMVKWASHEANSAYYPPKYLTNKDIENIINIIKN